MASENSRPALGSGAKGTKRFRGRVVKGGEGPVSATNIANLITVARILVAPVVLWLVVLDAGADGLWRYLAALLFVLGMVTDGIDGAIARSRNLITKSGTLLDPVADKVITGGAFIGLAALGEVPWWIVAVVIGRELLITGIRLSVLRHREIPVSRGGKAKTVSQAVALGALLVPFDTFLGDWWTWVAVFLLGIAVFLTVATGLDYLIRSLRGAPPSGERR